MLATPHPARNAYYYSHLGPGQRRSRALVVCPFAGEEDKVFDNERAEQKNPCLCSLRVVVIGPSRLLFWREQETLDFAG